MPSSKNTPKSLGSSRNESSRNDEQTDSTAPSAQSENTFRSPRSPPSLEKPSTDILLPVSPTSTTDVYLILDPESMGGTAPLHRTACSASGKKRLPNFSKDCTFWDSDPTFFDDDLSQYSSSDHDEDEWGEGEEEELLGLSFVEDGEQAAEA